MELSQVTAERTYPKVKICGIRSEEEARYLDEAKADYAGFVFYEKSRRNVSVEQYKRIAESLDRSIKKVAVVVSPDEVMLEKMNLLDIDILQIHGSISREMIKKSRHPVWRALNLSGNRAEVMQLKNELAQQMKSGIKITGLVMDGMEYGGGKTFDWQQREQLNEMREQFGKGEFILAGGLKEENVREGITLFSPDIVDVSSGVEREDQTGKDREKILNFIRKVRNK